jgi:hypothetical protein
VSNSFVRKVTAERQVLGIVNSLTPGARQLAGLSAGAIEAWRQHANIAEVDLVSLSLLKIAALCQLLSDRSHESFQSLDPGLMEKIELELVGLRALIGATRPK